MVGAKVETTGHVKVENMSAPVKLNGTNISDMNKELDITVTHIVTKYETS